MMTHIMKIAAVENAPAIWEYDPDLPDNHVLGGSLDVIVAIHTVAIKVILPMHFDFDLSMCLLVDSSIL